MAADLHIHVYEGITEEDLEVFFGNTLGSKFFDPSFERGYRNGLPNWKPLYEGDRDRSDRHVAYCRIVETPNVWVGEVSWLKAMIFEDGEETFIPDAVGRVQELIGESLPTLTPKLKQQLLDAFELPNKTQYRLSEMTAIETFLTVHLNKRLFTVSW